MSYPFLSLAAVVAVTTAAPALAQSPKAPQQLAAAQAQAPARPAPRPTTRADLLRTADSNFQKVDTNNDRGLSKAEIDAAQARAQQQAAANRSTRIAQEFAKLDSDRNGQLSLAEFRAAFSAPPAASDVSATAMQRLDTNKDGKISVEEYRAPILATFDRADTNRDGTISADERARAAAASPASDR